MSGSVHWYRNNYIEYKRAGLYANVTNVADIAGFSSTDLTDLTNLTDRTNIAGLYS